MFDDDIHACLVGVYSVVTGLNFGRSSGSESQPLTDEYM